MAWREDIAAYAKNGDVAGVLKIFDELDADRQRTRVLNDAYLRHIADILKGKPSPVGPNKSSARVSPPVPVSAVGPLVDTLRLLEACAKAREKATDALKAATARVGAP